MANAASHIPVSVFMITFNNARTVELALRSVAWADEIVVVDSGSTDGTLEICRKYTAHVLHHAWPGFRDQYQYAANQCRNDWALFIDADEEVSPELATEIAAELASNTALPDDDQVRGYYGHRRTWYLGRWIMHGGWVPDYEIRLYNRTFGRWLGDLHANIHITGTVAHLKRFYYHYTYADIAEQLRKIDSYSTTAASDMQGHGKRFSLFHALGNALFRGFRDYVLKRGFLDGFPGVVVAVSTMYYVFIKHAKLWELQHVGLNSFPPNAGGK